MKRILLLTIILLSVMGTTLAYANNEPLKECIVYDGAKLVKEPWRKNLCIYPFYSKNHLLAAKWLDNIIKGFSGEELKNYLYIEKLPINEGLEPTEGLAIGFCENEDGSRKKIEFVISPPKQINCRFINGNLNITGGNIEGNTERKYFTRNGRIYISIEDNNDLNNLLKTIAIVKGLEEKDYPKSHFDKEKNLFVIEFKEKKFKVSTLMPESKTEFHIKLREVFERLGYTVYWDKWTKSIIVI